MTDSRARRPTAAARRGLSGGAVRGVIVAIGVVTAAVAAARAINAVTPWPFVAIFRALIGLVKSAVTLGPYADRVAGVRESVVIVVPVDGAPDAELTIYTPADDDSAAKPIVLLVHGGGWVVGTASQISGYAKLLASEGFVVANLDYSLAPRHTYPIPIRQSAAALDWLRTHAGRFGGDVTKMFVAGNSAGAQIASQIGAIVTEPAFAAATGVAVTVPAGALRGVILYSGPYNFDTVKETGYPAFRSYAWSYTGRKDYENYARLDELSTVKNVTAAYPPTYLTSGDGDPLEPQTRELDAALRAVAVEVASRYWTGSGKHLPHDYIFDLRTKAARTAFDDTVAFLRTRSR